jgi:fluoride exporter
MGTLRIYSIIGLGSALGGLARYLCGLAASQWGGEFPWGTLLVNVVGSLVIGCFVTLTGPDGRVYVRTMGRQFIMIGLCGGYTTFSAFSLETLQLLRAHRPAAAVVYVLASLLLGLVAVWVGHAAAQKVNQ